MLFLNPWLLLGLLAVAIPIVIHLLNRQSARFMDWGAMLFLQDSFSSRRSRIHLEDVLLMATRCLLLGLLALAVARPFIAAGSLLTWVLVLPLALVGLGCLAAWSVMRDEPVWRRRLAWGGVGGLVLAGLLVGGETLVGRRFGGVDRDVVIILDASTSMGIRRDGRTNFGHAREEARKIIRESQPNAAFGIVLASGMAEAVFPAPVLDRKDLLQRLDKLEPGAGTMSLPQAISVAVSCLAQGTRGPKQIVVISDGQALNWNLQDTAEWASLRETVKSLPVPPQVVWRRLPFPATYRNVAIERVALPGSSSGVGQETLMDVTFRNTGHEAVTPSSVRLTVGEGSQTLPAGGQLAPGSSATVRFRQRFAQAGVQTVTVSLVVEDDLEEDNSVKVVVPVSRSLHVLVVDGSPAPALLDRAAGFAVLGLAPDEAAKMVPQVEMAKTRYAMKTTVIDAPNILKVESFAPYHAVILAGVARLPADVADRLARYVENGGGLFIAPGGRIDAEFYNGWFSSGVPFLPAKLSRWTRADVPALRRPALETFKTDTLKALADSRTSDLDTWTLDACWDLEPLRSMDVSVAARFDNGQPLLLERRKGRGRILLSAFPLDASAGNLVSRQAYVPLLHNLVYSLSESAAPELNLEAAPNVTLTFSPSLAGNPLSQKTSGLQGEYFDGSIRGTRADLVRIDPAIELDWSESPVKEAATTNKLKRQSVGIRWTGSLMPPKTGKYAFKIEGERMGTLWIDGKVVMRGSFGNAKGSAALVAGQRVDLRMEYLGSAKDKVRLAWTLPDEKTATAIPSSCLSPSRGEAAMAELNEQLTVLDPAGRERDITASMHAGLVALTLPGRSMVGLYRVKTTYTLRNVLGDLVDSNGDLPFTVHASADESGIEALPASAVVLSRQYIDLMEANTPRDVLMALSGKRFGQELWRILAWIALLLVVVEIGLARWIAGNRRTGQEKRVAFDDAAAAAEALGKSS